MTTTQENNLTIFDDRMPVALLQEKDPELLAALKNWSVGKVQKKETVHFCGMVCLPKGRLAVFIPRAAKASSKGQEETAQLTMHTLARYGRDALNRQFLSDGTHGNPGQLAVVLRLAEDFRQHGLFYERQRIRAREVGKPDWKRTVARSRSFPAEGGGVIFDQIQTTRTVDSTETLLAQVQAAVLSEIIAQHGWWLPPLKSRNAELRTLPRPSQPRMIWPVLLDALLPSLYSSRSIFLATYLAHYLRQQRASSDGAYVFGVEDFHTVWETMLRQTLSDVEDGWNSKLPKPVYISNSGEQPASDKGMRTDIILRSGSEFTIVDAKYYLADSAQSAPGWPDIAKQLFYQVALKNVVPRGAKIRNLFVFPSGRSGRGHLSEVQVLLSDGTQAEGFGSVQCRYLDVVEVMQAYKAHRADIRIPQVDSMDSSKESSAHKS